MNTAEPQLYAAGDACNLLSHDLKVARLNR